MLPIIEEYYPKDLKEEDIALFVLSVVAMAVFYMLTKSFSENRKIAARIKMLQERRAQLKGNLVSNKRRSRKRDPSASGSMSIMKFVVAKLNLLQKSQVGKLNKMLVNAGYRSKDAMYVYSFFQLVCPIFALVVGLVDLKIDFSNPLASKMNIITLLGGVFFGFKLPQLMVMNAMKKRYDRMQKGLSDTLDLMMICAEAGLSLAATLDRVSRELGDTYVELAEELSLTSIELGFLPDRKKALSNLAERVNMPEIRGIAGVLIQTEKYGTPVAQALRVLSAEFRTQRMLRAEQKAARLPAIMTVPMIIFILPTLFVVVLAPAMLKVVTMF